MQRKLDPNKLPYFSIRNTKDSMDPGSQLVRSIVYNNYLDGNLFHYTTLDGLKGIVEESGFWLTHAEFLNDSNEINHGWERIKAIISELYDDNFDIFFKNLALKINTKNNNIFIGCFSKSGDSLDMWRTYSKNEIGISIELDLSSPNRTPSLEAFPLYHLSEVLYDDISKDTNIKKIIEFAKVKIKDDLDNDINYDNDDYEDAANFIFTYLNLYSEYMKDCSFKTEEEVRLVYARSLGKQEKAFPYLHFRKSSLGFIPYIKTSELANNDPNYKLPKIPLKKIIIGPTQNYIEIKRSISMFLEYNGYDNIEILPSKIPFR